jgi:hypothetical protein
MTEFLNRVQIINIIALVIILTCSALAIILAFKHTPIPDGSMKVIDTYFQMCLVGLVGWAFTRSQNAKQSTP